SGHLRPRSQARPGGSTEPARHRTGLTASPADALRAGARRRRLRPRHAPVAALVAAPLDLTSKVLGALGHRGDQVGRLRARAQRHALEVEGGLHHHGLANRGVLLLAQLDVDLSQLGDLPADLLEALLDLLAHFVRYVDAPTLDCDSHPALLMSVLAFID